MPRGSSDVKCPGKACNFFVDASFPFLFLLLSVYEIHLYLPPLEVKAWGWCRRFLIYLVIGLSLTKLSIPNSLNFRFSCFIYVFRFVLFGLANICRINQVNIDYLLQSLSLYRSSLSSIITKTLFFEVGIVLPFPELSVRF